MSKKYKYEEMLPQEFLEKVKELPVFFVPTGLLEWHGDHLPLGLDGLKAHGLCMAAAKKLGGGIVLPTNYFGRPGFSSYVGTLTYSEGCLDTLFTEMFDQLRKVGAKVIVVLTGHYGPLQEDFISRVAKYYTTEHPDVKIIAQPEYVGVTVDGMIPADHAGKWETSMFWYMNPELTHMENYKLETNKKKIYDNPPQDYYKEPEEWEWMDDLRETASKELGEKCVEVISEYLKDQVLKALEN